jgi:hypothetical protein
MAHWVKTVTTGSVKWKAIYEPTNSTRRRQLLELLRWLTNSPTSCNRNVHGSAHNRPSVLCILSQLKQVYTLQPFICNIRLNIILPSAPRSSKWPLCFTPSKQIYKFLSSLMSATYLAQTILTHLISLIIFSDHKSVSQTLRTARSANQSFVADSSLKQTHNLHACWQSSPHVL